MYFGPAGFYKAPVAKVFLGLTAAASLVNISSASLKHNWTLSYQALFQDWQLWRLIPASLAFHSLPELVCGLYLIYFFRLFERQLGSARYAVFVLFTHIGSCLLEAALVFALGPLSGDPDSALDEHQGPNSSPWLSSLPFPASGPYGLIFASYVLYALDVPPTARFTLFSQLQFSDKALLYLGALQLLFSSWSHSIAPGLCGICMGLLFRYNFCGVRKAQVPAPVVAAAAHYLSFVLSPPPAAPQPGRTPSPGRPQAGTDGVGAAAAAAAGQGHGVPLANAANARGTAQTPPWTQGMLGVPGGASALYGGGSGFGVVPPPQEVVEQLLAMGFDRESALQALAQARNDLTVATNLLLESQHLG